MNKREREQERERERRRTCKSKIITLSPSSSPSPRGDPPTARLFVFFFSRGRRKRFYARGEKFENFSHIRVCGVCGFARAHIYIHIHTRGRDKERKRERERIRDRVREIITERKEVFIKCYLLLLFFIYHTSCQRQNPKHPMSHFFFLFVFLRNT